MQKNLDEINLRNGALAKFLKLEANGLQLYLVADLEAQNFK